MPTILNVHNDARALLNDTFADVFTDAILLPFTKKAYQEMQDELSLNGIETTFARDFVQNIPAGTVEVVKSTDLIAPLELWEKPQGNPDTDYVLMTEKNWEPNITVVDTLRFWKFDEDEIRFPGATANVTVLVKYNKFLATINNTSDPIPIINSQNFLAARVAAIAAFCVGGNPDIATILNADAGVRLNKIIAIAVKRNQLLGTRRQPNRSFG